jgi:hypothetical protein
MISRTSPNPRSVSPGPVGFTASAKPRREPWGRVVLAALLSVLVAVPAKPARGQAAENVIKSVGHISHFVSINKIDLQRARVSIPLGIGTPIFAGDDISVGDGAELHLNFGATKEPLIIRGSSRYHVSGSPPDPSLVRRVSSRITSTLGALFAPSVIIPIYTGSGRGDELDFPQGPLRPSPLLPPGKYAVAPTTRSVAVLWRGNADRLNIEWGKNELQVLGGPRTLAYVPLPSGATSIRISARQGAENRLVWEVERSLALPPLYPADRHFDTADFIFALELLGFLDEPAPNREAWRLEGLSRLTELSTRYYPAEVILRALRQDRLELR